MITCSGKGTQSPHHGWSSDIVDRLEAFMRPRQVCVPLALLPGISAKPEAAVESPDGCAGNSGWAPAVAATTCLP